MNDRQDARDMFADPILAGAFEPLPTKTVTAAVRYIRAHHADDVLDMLGLSA